jgi:hypothetical protein
MQQVEASRCKMLISPEERYLLDELKQYDLRDQERFLSNGLKRTPWRFVFDYGWWYNPTNLSFGVEKGKLGECAKNAFDLCSNNQSLTYCQGYAITNIGQLPTFHAWATNGDCQVIDNTWEKPGIAYAGVPFKWEFIETDSLQNQCKQNLIDNYGKNWPLLGLLGDQPDKWLESVKGNGRIAIKECS